MLFRIVNLARRRHPPLYPLEMMGVPYAALFNANKGFGFIIMENAMKFSFTLRQSKVRARDGVPCAMVSRFPLSCAKARKGRRQRKLKLCNLGV